MKKSRKALATALAIITLGGALYVAGSIAEMSSPAGGGKVAVFHVEKGDPLGRVARDLENDGLIRSKTYFSWLAKSRDLESSIRAGEYEISSDWKPERILDVLVSGKVVKKRFTVPEGFTLEQIAERLHEKGIVSREQFLKAASDTSLMKKWLAPSAENLEGVLFPETYTYTSADTPRDIVKMMCAQFEKVFAPVWERRPPDYKLSAYEAITLASIVEKETAVDSEKNTIAAVFMNRLRRGMRLMSDPTVIYGLDQFDGNLTRKHLRTPTPYNTYVNPGLPPGPICNPGETSLRAALNPADTDALYFVSRGDGTHQFSKTLTEHNRAVRRYQLGKGD